MRLSLRWRLAFFGRVARRFSGRLTLVLFLLVLAGLAEGIGIAVLLPLLSLLTESTSADRSTLEILTLNALSALHLEPKIGVLLFLTAAGIVLKAGLVMLSMSVVGIAMVQTATDLRTAYLRAILSANWTFFTNTPVGNISNAMSLESIKAAALLASFAQMAAAVVGAIILLAIASLVSWQITVAAVVAGMVLLGSLSRLVVLSRKAGQREAIGFAEMSSRMGDAVQGIKPIKAMAREKLLEPAFDHELTEINKALRFRVVTSEASKTLQEPILVIFLAAGLFALIVFGDRPIESLIVMALLFQRSANQFGKLQQAYQRIVSGEGFFFQMIDRTQKAEAAAEQHFGTKTPGLRQKITITDLSFFYDGGKVLDAVSLDVIAGKITSLIGPSGSGKTTLTDLILGLQIPSGGQIRIDGVPIDEVDMRAWRSMVGYVPQELFLFHDTIRQNITLGASNVTEADLAMTLESSGAAKFVSEMADGLDTVVGERGSKISGGQRQRIALARALLMKPTLLILDEPSTALDPQAVAEICATLKALRNTLTILAISHQPAIADISDVIYQMSDGKILKASAQSIGADPSAD
jgi:ATP-binding cassette subfamily C protein